MCTSEQKKFLLEALSELHKCRENRETNQNPDWSGVGIVETSAVQPGLLSPVGEYTRAVRAPSLSTMVGMNQT